MHLRFTLLALIITTINVFSVRVEACSCIAPGPPCQAYWKSSTVFVGQVTAMAEATHTEERMAGFAQRLVRFAVTEPLREVSGTTVEAYTGMGGGDCGYAFKVGESYLVYAHRNPQNNKLYASICSRTRLLQEAGEDLDYIRSLAKAEPGGTIFGSVTRFRRGNADVSYQPKGPMERVRLTIEGAGPSREVMTDGKGEYRITGVAPGSYKVKVTLPEGLWTYETERKVEVQDRGCALINYTLEPDTSLGGGIVDEQGQPATKITVDLVPSEQINERHMRGKLMTHTNEEGRFEFRSIPPGKYLLGVRLNRIMEASFAYPRTFYPGTQDQTQAEVIEISEGQTLEGYDLQLPPKLTTRKIEGRIVWPDGRPAPKAGICFEEVEYAEGALCLGGDAKVDEEGRFWFTVLEGMRYIVRSHVNVGGGGSVQRHAEPVEVPRNGHVNDLKLIISEPNGNCGKCLRWKRKMSE